MHLYFVSASHSYILIVDVFHDFCGWLSQELSNQGEMVYIVLSREENFSQNHLRQNTSDAPDIYSIGVFLPSQYDLWSSIVSCGDIASHLLVLFSSQPKVTDFQVAVVVEQDVARFEVAMDDTGRMNEF